MQVVLTLIIACFWQLDVAAQSDRLDTLEETREIKDLETQTQAFLSSVVQSILPVIAKAQMRLVIGLFGILLESDVVEVARTRVCMPPCVMSPTLTQVRTAWNRPPHPIPQSGGGSQAQRREWL